VITAIFKDVELKSGVQRFVIRNGGNKEEADLIFDDMIVQFVKTVFTTRDFQISGELNAYLTGIAKHLWFAQLRQKKLFHPSEFPEEFKGLIDTDQPEQLFLTNERGKILQELLAKLRANCREVLMHWANGYSMEEISIKLNYQSEGMARKKKSHCLKELLLYLQNNPHIKSLLGS
jgi:DNA-directed RNA polymerase specialized sigma24 family protein